MYKNKKKGARATSIASVEWSCEGEWQTYSKQTNNNKKETQRLESCERDETGLVAVEGPGFGIGIDGERENYGCYWAVENVHTGRDNLLAWAGELDGEHSVFFE